MSLSRGAASFGLLAISALHVLWASGSSWPAREPGAISGRGAEEAPSAPACLAVAGLLAAAAAFVDGHPRRSPRISRAGATGVVAVLASRGAVGLAGCTDLVARGSATTEEFRRLDRRVYSPLCLTLAALALPATAGSSR